MVMRLSEDIFMIIVLALIPDFILDNLGIYDSAMAIINSRKKHIPL